MINETEYHRVYWQLARWAKYVEVDSFFQQQFKGFHKCNIKRIIVCQCEHDQANYETTLGLLCKATGFQTVQSNRKRHYHAVSKRKKWCGEAWHAIWSTALRKLRMSHGEFSRWRVSFESTWKLGPSESGNLNLSRGDHFTGMVERMRGRVLAMFVWVFLLSLAEVLYWLYAAALDVEQCTRWRRSRVWSRCEYRSFNWHCIASH
jgi:hypothetical protein